MKHILLPAYNLVPSAVFVTGVPLDADLPELRKFCVTQVLYRHTGTERVGILCRVVGEYEPGNYPGEGTGKYDTFSFDFNDTVALIGLCVNPDTWDDVDFGQAFDRV